MGKYLDSRGLVTLWNKIKSYFVDIYDRIESVETNLEGVVYSEDGDASAGYSSTSSIEDRLLPECIIPKEDGLYQDRNGIIYPVSHPPLSTQPSILPQSFGTYDIYEVLVSNTLDFVNGNKKYYNVGDNSINTTGYTPSTATIDSNSGNQFRLCYDSSISKFYITPYEYSGVCFLEVDSFVIRCNDFGLVPIRETDDGTFNKCYIISLPIEYYYYYSEEIQRCYNQWLHNSNGYPSGIVKVSYDYSNFSIVKSQSSIIITDIPSNATIIEASVFNSNNCVPAICEKTNNKWIIKNNETIIPDFALVRYFKDRNDYYYNINKITNTNKVTITNIAPNLPGFPYPDFEVSLSRSVTAEEIVAHLKCYIFTEQSGYTSDNNSLYICKVSNNNIELCVQQSPAMWLIDYTTNPGSLFFVCTSTNYENFSFGFTSIIWE